MGLEIGSSPVPGWTIRFPVKKSHSAESHRVVDERGKPAFFKTLNQQEYFDRKGQLLEVSILGSINHSGIPALIESGVLSTDGRPYLITEMVPGETLNYRLSRETALAPSLASYIMETLMETVAYLHGLEDWVVHGEVAPSNILLDARDGQHDRPFLIDFGHARRQSDGSVSSSSDLEWNYLPPERTNNTQVSRTMDVFALGATYFHVLFGELPWRSGASVQVHGRVASDTERRGPLLIPKRNSRQGVNPATLDAIRKALSHHPDDRFADAGEFLEAVTQAHGHPILGSRSIPPSNPEDSLQLPRGFRAVAGMSELKEMLTRDVIDALRNEHKYRKFGVSIPNGLLLYGPPGCGKTYIAEKLAEELGFAFRTISPSSVASIYVHGTQEKIADLFDAARINAPCVLFLDEVDALLPAREGNIQHHYAADVNEWLVQMDGCGEDGVFLLAATNQPHRIDSATMRAGRIDKRVYVGTPDGEARKGIFEIHLGHRPVDASVDCEELARLTKGRVASDIRFLVDEAARLAVSSGDDSIEMSHLLEAIKSNRPSVGPRVLAAYEKMREQFESEQPGRQFESSPSPFT